MKTVLTAVLLLFLGYLTLFLWIVKATPTLALHPADAIVVLGAAAWGERPSPVLKNRLETALAIYRRNLAAYIIFTGGTPRKNYASEGEISAKWALKQQIPPDAVLIDGNSRNTLENLLAVQAIARNNGLKNFIIVSDAYHLPRARIFAALLGLTCQTAATPNSGFDRQSRENKLKTYVKETNSALAGCVYYLYLKIKSFKFS